MDEISTKPAEQAGGWWSLDDLKRAYQRVCDDPTDSEAPFFMGKAMQLAGHAVEANDQFAEFRRRSSARFGGLDAAIQHYEEQLKRPLRDLASSAASIEDVRTMLAVLCASEISGRRMHARSQGCTIA